MGPVQVFARAVNASIRGILPIYPATTTNALPITAMIYPLRFSLYIPFHLPTSVGVKIRAIISGIFTAQAN